MANLFDSLLSIFRKKQVVKVQKPEPEVIEVKFEEEDYSECLAENCCLEGLEEDCTEEARTEHLTPVREQMEWVYARSGWVPAITAYNIKKQLQDKVLRR